MPKSAAQEFADLQRLKPQAAVDYLQGRGLLTKTFSWQDLWHEEHAQQFTVSRLARLDLLKAMQDGITKSVEGDLSRRDWTRDIKSLLKKEGWWGEIEVLDPLSGEAVTTKFDSARLKLIFDTNTRMANSAGLWERIERNKVSHPYIRYITRGDERVRDSHRRWNGLTLPVDHPFWQTHWPPNGWHCRCRAMSMTQREYDQRLADGSIQTEAPAIETRQWINKRTGEITYVPVGVDPGFDYNAGVAKARVENLQKQVANKLATAPEPLAKAAQAAGLTKNDLPATLDRIAAEIAGKPEEQLVLLNRSGNELVRQVGTKDMVKLSDEMLRQLADGVLIHNHPETVESFSVADVQLAVWHRLQETHVVDRLYRYSIARPEGADWGPAFWVETVAPIVERVEKSVVQRVADAVAGGKIGKDESAPLIDHMIWEEVNAEVNIGYRRVHRINNDQ